MNTLSFFKKLLFSLSLFLAFALTLVVASPVFAQVNNPNPVIWKTKYAKFASSDFYIRIADKYFRGIEPVSVHSDPGSDLTTLELVWTENNVVMRMFMYFRTKDQNEWELYDLRTYNGQSDGDWIYYSPTDSLGNEVESIPGYVNFAAERRFKPKSGVDAEIYCKECSFAAFSTEPLNYSSEGYALEILSSLGADETITVTNNGNTGYGVNALLRDKNRAVVTNQSGMRYEWTSQNSNVAKVFPGNIEYAEGGCAYAIQTPCPNMNGQIAGINPGVTTITVNVLRDNKVIASNHFDVKVVASLPNSVPSPSPSVQPSSSPTPSPQTAVSSDQQIQKELESLKGTVGEIKLDVARQQEDLNAIQKVLKSISSFLSRIFSFK